MAARTATRSRPASSGSKGGATTKARSSGSRSTATRSGSSRSRSTRKPPARKQGPSLLAQAGHGVGLGLRAVFRALAGVLHLVAVGIGGTVRAATGGAPERPEVRATPASIADPQRDEQGHDE